MTQFQFVMVLLSLIVGLGVTDLLSNVARQLKDRESWKFSWLQSLLVVFVFVALLQQWWESWGLQSIEHWNFGSMLWMLAGPIGLYIAAHLLYPKAAEDVDLETHYFDNSKAFWLIAAAVVVVATLFRPISFGMPLLDFDNLASIVLFGSCMVLGLIKHPLLHKTLAPLLLTALLLDIFVFNPSI
ncbi:hypothetical protein HFP51_12730 [Parasphingopyxis sp. CP4]|uniref:hypothetical protein n=1 Tax=Parasphingopyxis sp. CP4 TaxID=2724527 RepID=UPI0015A23B13|nr:hypothetical protein [Parasphingopyxis sp. CP4]QLC22974.1 hypothetical protein HFP51_12730 [Parasphingopyxis sp. CP4]